eukprot:942716-Amphidinium_carterae.1
MPCSPLQAIIANISPASSCYVETLSTLKFAARAKHIRCVAVRNEDGFVCKNGINDVELDSHVRNDNEH